MKIQTFSVVIGTRACNARCPFCVSRMTGFGELPAGSKIHERHLAKAVAAARRGGTTTVLFTGKGEPTLYPAEITRYLELIGDAFPFIELQTNALEIGRLARDGTSRIKGLTRDALRTWCELGLNTIAISVVDVRADVNAEVYHPDYPDLATTIGFIKELGFSVRLCVMMQRGAVDSTVRVEDVLDFCRGYGVEQLTVRPIRKPASTESAEASEYVMTYGLTGEEVGRIQRWVDAKGTHLLTLMHGAKIYDVGGQNICVSDCLTLDSKSDDIRTLIFYSDGRLAYDWQYDGAVLLGGRSAST